MYLLIISISPLNRKTNESKRIAQCVDILGAESLLREQKREMIIERGGREKIISSSRMSTI